MAIVIKEIEVKTIVEKRVVNETEIPDTIYQKIINSVISELKQNQLKPPSQLVENKRER